MAVAVLFVSLLLQNPIIIVIAAAFFLFIAFTRIKTKSASKSILNLPPGSYGWPVLGELVEFLGAGIDGRPERFIRERIEKYNSAVFKTKLMGEKVVVFSGAAGNKFLYSNENKAVSVWWPGSMTKLLEPSLVNKAGDEAKFMRKMMSYYVGPDALTKLYIHTMDLVTQRHLTTHWQGREQMKVFPTIKLYTFELACRIFMSLEDPQHIAKLDVIFNVFLKGGISLPIDFPGTRFYSAKKAAIAVKKELVKIIIQRRAALEEKSASPSQDLLSHLIANPDENGKFMPESEIVNNILVLLLAGHDTTSVTITMVMKYLAESPQVYEKVLQEQMGIASSKGEGEFLKWEDVQKMKYSWNVVSEVRRLNPPVFGAFREAIVDFNYAGYDIPKGWKLFWSTTYTHRDESLFPDNSSFDPSRFDGSGPTPFSYVPFGGGPHMCLGKEFLRVEILVFLHNVVKRFWWNLVIPDEKIIYDPVLIPVKGLPIRLQSRDT